jgi:HD-like signal output (HDOD) protein
MTSTESSPSVLAHFVQRARRLYTLPAVAMKVIELTGHPKVDVRKLKECIENDPALTAKILRVVNSSLFGLSREITDLNQALALLGVKPLKLLVLGFSLPAELFDGLESHVLERYWRHTLTKAVAAREIAESIWKIQGDEPFISGLLQGIGMLALIQDLGEDYLAFLDRVQSEGADLAALESKALGFDHAILSARLLDHWGLPPSVCQAVGMQHDVERLTSLDSAQADVPQILHLAELCSALLTQQRPDVLQELLDVGQRYRGLTTDQLEQLVGSLDEKVRQLADVLSLQLPDDLHYADILASAHARASEVAEQWITEGGGEEQLLGEVGALAALARRVASQDALRSSDGLASPIEESKGLHHASGDMCREGSRESAAAVRESLPPASAVGADAATDPQLVGRVASAVASCRQARCELTLLFTQLDRYDELMHDAGPAGGAATGEPARGGGRVALGRRRRTPRPGRRPLRLDHEKLRPPHGRRTGPPAGAGDAGVVPAPRPATRAGDRQRRPGHVQHPAQEFPAAGVDRRRAALPVRRSDLRRRRSQKHRHLLSEPKAAVYDW